MASSSDLDALRAAHPELGLAVYAYEPGGAVVLEVHTPDGELFTWSGATLAECLARAFPPEPEPPTVDIFA